MSININPIVWGPSAWKFMHYITLSYPDNPSGDDKINIRNFFTSIQHLLPCEKCRHHFSNYIKQYPLDDNVMRSRHNLSNWLLVIHNNVNKSLNKPIMTYNEMIKLYLPENIKEKFTTESNNSVIENIQTAIINIDTTLFITIFIVVLILILMLVIRIKNM